jgi:hypothetical protein
MTLEENVNNLKRLTQELAEEVHHEEYGDAFKYIHLLFDKVESYIVILDNDCKILYLNPSVIKNCKEKLGISVGVGDNCLKLLKDGKELCKDCVVKTCVNQRKVLNQIIISPNTGIKYWKTCIPLVYNGVSGVIEILEEHNG